MKLISYIALSSMGKRLILITFIFFNLPLFSRAHGLEFKLARNMKSATVCSPTDTVLAGDILHFAETLIGTPYRPKSSSPLLGFDCSGFVSYVFKKFNFNVPRSSGDFISIGKKMRLEDALPGDIILFTGPQKNSRKIGHVGIVYTNANGEFKFIHSTSGKEYGVTITAMDKNYLRRFVQIIRLLM